MWIYHAERPAEVMTRPPFLVVKAVAALHLCIVPFEPRYTIALSMLRLVHEASRHINNLQLLVCMLNLVHTCPCKSACWRYTTSRLLASTVLHEGSTTCEHERLATTLTEWKYMGVTRPTTIGIFVTKGWLLRSWSFTPVVISLPP